MAFIKQPNGDVGMGFYIEPIYMNEKMILNCGAYLFRGVSMETENSTQTSTKGKGTGSLGFTFLQSLISPVSVSVEGEKGVTTSEKTARRYTLGGLHMTLIDELRKEKNLNKVTSLQNDPSADQFVEIDAILKPIDFFNIIDACKVSLPLVTQFLKNFGDKFQPALFNKATKDALPSYTDLVSSILTELEDDYLKSGRIEMVMIDPNTRRQIGVVDIDLGDMTAQSVKAKLTDGRFKIIGRVYRYVGPTDRISIIQRTSISSVLNIIEKLVGDSEEGNNYRSTMETAKNFAERACQFYIDGPAVRVMAMSICI